MASCGSSEDSMNLVIDQVIKELQGSMLSLQLQKAAQCEVMKSSLRMTDLKKGVIQGLTKSGMERQLRNAVYRSMQLLPRPSHPIEPPDHYKEPIAYIRKSQMNWEKRILKSLNSMCTELSVALARKRTEKEQREIAVRWSELGTDEPDLSQFRPVYAPKDLLEVIANIKNPNIRDSTEANSPFSRWGIIQVPLKVKDIHELIQTRLTCRREMDMQHNALLITLHNFTKLSKRGIRLQFSEMSINQCQSGVDDLPDIPAELFQQDRTKFSKKVLSTNQSALAQEFAKKGVPLGLRGALWSQILVVEVDDIDILYYDQLKACVFQHDMLVDSLIYKDVKLTATNDDQYFVFEDYIYQILLPFARDTYMLKFYEDSSATPPKSYLRGKLGVDEFMVNYPPNGIIPFHGFAMYVAPLCYIYDDPVVLYFVFRQLYVRYFFRLHTLSSHPQGIISLCLQFESLLQTSEPQLFFHLKSIGIQPLRIAFKWLIRAFSGYLSSDQVLILWDRVMAYGSLELLPVLATAIFSFRKTNLLQVLNPNAAEAVLADITTLQVMPLIQLTLFSQ